jgi:hypothetical protein
MTAETGPTAEPGTPAVEPHDPELRAAGQLTSPTWELELFLSGAFVFATLQLPDAIDAFTYRMEPHTVGTTRTILLNATLYAKAIAFTLIGTFLLHLIGRGQWVALMGLQSVFPAGIRWEKLKLGPIAEEVYRDRAPQLRSMIGKVDNFCSVVFGVGFLFVLFFVFSLTAVGILGGAAYLVGRATGNSDNVQRIFLSFAALFALVPTVSGVLDKKRGASLSRDSTSYRVLRRGVRVSTALATPMSPIMFTLMSNVGRARVMAVMYVVIFAIIGLSVADILVGRGQLVVNSYDYFAASQERGVDPRHYENLRGDGRVPPRMPFIQADMIRDPYVRLFIPYAPGRHNAAIQRSCPGTKPLQKRGLQVGDADPAPDSLAVPVLDCLARLHAVTLDGAPVAGLRLDFHEHAGTGLNGMLAYIPIDSLARGRHVITVMPMPPQRLPTDSAALATAAWKRPFVIPFWR